MTKLLRCLAAIGILVVSSASVNAVAGNAAEPSTLSLLGLGLLALGVARRKAK